MAVVDIREQLARRRIEKFKKRMGWRFDWASFGSDFNFDYGVSFPKEEVAKGQVSYNYAMSPAFGSLEKVRLDGSRRQGPAVGAGISTPRTPDARSGVNPRVWSQCRGVQNISTPRTPQVARAGVNPALAARVLLAVFSAFLCGLCVKRQCRLA